jgi:uncharacterized protein
MKPYLVLFIFLAPLCAFSQTDAKTEKIKNLMDVMGSSKMFEQMKTMMVAQFRKEAANISDDSFQKAVEKSMNTDSLLKKVAGIYNKYYSEEDIDHITEFYQTPTGKKVIETMPKIMQESMSVGQSWGMASHDSLMKILSDSTNKKSH